MLQAKNSTLKRAASWLLSNADILIHNFHPRDRAIRGLEAEVLSRNFPSLITVGISPFGDSGPYKDWKAYPLNVENAGGMAFLAPGGSEFPDLPPLRAFGDQAEYQGGLHACFAALAIYLNRLGGGAPSSVEISEQECLAAMLELNLMFYTYTGRESSRLGKRGGPWLLAECRDGHAFVLCVEEPQWQRMVEFMGDPEWAHEELFKDRIARIVNSDALHLFVREWMTSWKKEELFHAGQAKRIPFAKVNTMKDILDDGQLNFRKYFAEIECPGRGKIRVPGAPSRYGVQNSPARLRAPRLRQHGDEVLKDESAAVSESPNPPGLSSKGLPLAGIRILDFTWAWAGPFATLQMAHMGAEVLRIESEKRVCITRVAGPFADNAPGPNRSGYFNQYNQGKRSITLNLSDPAGLQVAYDLVPHCDVVVENFAGGVASKIGLGYERLRQFRPDLIMLSMSGYGQDGPYRGYLGYGPPAAALSGFFFTTGYEGMPPMELGVSYMDPNAGIFGAIAVINALIHRKKTGQGQFIDQSQLETAVQLMAEGLLQYQITGNEPQRVGNHHAMMSPHNTYKAAGNHGKWVSIAVGTEAEWRALCEVIGKPELACDPRFSTLAARKQNEDELDGLITEWTSTRDRWAITEALQRAGVAAFPSMSNKDLATNEHLCERGFLVQLEHPEVGCRTHAGIPWTLDGQSSRVAAPAPVRGADTEAVLSKLLGYTPQKIDQLRQAGALS